MPIRLPLRVVDGLILVWVALVAYATLSPFEFEIPESFRSHLFPAPEWKPPDGMRFRGAGLFSFGRPSPDIADAITTAGAFSLTAEIRPASTRAAGPARILTYGTSRAYEAFMLGQAGRDVVVRLADPSPDRRISQGHTYLFAADLEPGTWSRVTVTVTASEIRAFRDGHPIGHYPDPVFRPETWSRACRLVAGNVPELEREWLGAVRALDLTAGTPPESTTLFEISGDRGVPPGWRPSHQPDVGRLTVPWLLRPFSEPAHRQWARTDWTLNALLLLPLGALLALRRTRLVAIAGALLATSLAIEVTQLFLPARYTQTTDLVLNVAGGLLGALVVARLAAFIESRTRPVAG